MGTAGKKRRKDFTTAKQATETVAYFFTRVPRGDDYRVDFITRKEILRRFLERYDFHDDAQAWFAKVKETAGELGFASEMKEYKQNPEAYRGNVADVAEVLRIATTGKANTPDLYTIQQILGEEETRARLRAAAEKE